MDDFKLIVNKKLYDSISDGGTHYTQFNIISDNTDNIDKLTKEIVDEFIEQILIGEINPETNTRDIEIEFNLIRLD